MNTTRSTRRRTRALAGIAVASLLTAGLAACGDGGSDDPTTEPTTDPTTSATEEPSEPGEAGEAGEAWEGVDDGTTLTMWTRAPLERQAKMLVDAYNASHQNQVALEIIPNDDMEGRVGAAANNNDLPDLLAGDVVRLPYWVANGLFTDMTAQIDSLPFIDDVAVGHIDAGTSPDGAKHTVPFVTDISVMAWNKDLYEQAGITEAPSTWEDVAENARKIQDLGTIGFAYPEESEYPAWTMANLVWGYGGAWSDEWDLSTLTSDETVAALTFAQDLVNEGAAAVVSGDPSTAFSAGAAGQVIASTGSLRGILEAATFEVGAAFLPAGPAADSGIVPTGGAGLAVSAASSPEKQLAAAKLATYLNNAENTAFFSAGTGYLPVRTNADMSSVYAENPLFEVAVEQLELTRSQDFARVFIPGGDRVLAQNLQKILSSGADVAATLEAAQTEIQANFDRDLKDKVG